MGLMSLTWVDFHCGKQACAYRVREREWIKKENLGMDSRDNLLSGAETHACSTRARDIPRYSNVAVIPSLSTNLTQICITPSHDIGLLGELLFKIQWIKQAVVDPTCSDTLVGQINFFTLVSLGLGWRQVGVDMFA